MTPHPFVRGEWLGFANYAAFEEELRKTARQDADYRKRLDASTEPWMKLRLEEVLGVWYLVRALRWPAESEYRIAHAGAAMDIEVRNGSEVHQLQVTTSGPIWPGGSPHWGLDHKLQLNQLRKSGFSSGWGPFKQLPSGEIENYTEAISSEERDSVFGAGLKRALENKSSHQSPDLELVVAAFGFECWGAEYLDMMARQALEAVTILGFSAVHFVTNDSEVYFCMRKECLL